MKKTASLLFGVSIALMTSAALPNGKKDQEMDIEITHNAPAQPFTLFVTANGLKGHLNHGDCIVVIQDKSAEDYDADYEAFVYQAVADAGFFPYNVCGLKENIPPE